MRHLPGRTSDNLATDDYRWLQLEDVEEFAEWILDPQRQLPIVAITSRADLPGTFWISPSVLCRALQGAANVVAMDTGPVSRKLGAALPDSFSVYGGAVRIWWPGCSSGSNPFGHPLFFAYHSGCADQAVKKILRAIEAYPLNQPSSSFPIQTDGEIREAEIVSLNGSVIARVGNHEGPLLSDFSQAVLTDALAPCQSLPVRQIIGSDGKIAFSSVGILSDAWSRIDKEYSVGDVVWVQVVRVEETYAVVSLLPGAKGIVHVSEIDWNFVPSLSLVLNIGDVIKVRIEHLDPKGKRCHLSLKNALPIRNEDVKPRIPLILGGKLFPPEPEVEDLSLSVPEGISVLEDELEAQLASAKKRISKQHREEKRMKKEIRSLNDQLQAHERPDPFSCEREFKRAIRIAHVGALEETDIEKYPLGKMAVGKEFLESARQQARQGISAEKVVEACMQVACGIAREINGLEVHRFRKNAAGQDTLRRASDGAGAWRCSLQVKTASARRLHWWVTPDGVEFALVGVHDDFRMPG